MRQEAGQAGTETAPQGAASTRAELVRQIGSMLAEWEESGDLYKEFSERLVGAVLASRFDREFLVMNP